MHQPCFYLRPTSLLLHYIPLLSPISIPSSHSYIINFSFSPGLLFSSAYKHTASSPFLNIKNLSQLCFLRISNTQLQQNSSKEISILPFLLPTLDPTATTPCESKSSDPFSNLFYVNHPYLLAQFITLLDKLSSLGLQVLCLASTCSPLLSHP